MKKYYVSNWEREQLQEETANRVVKKIGGPVGFYEDWSGVGPRLTIPNNALTKWRSFCKLVWDDPKRRQQCQQNHEARAAACQGSEISLCWLGLHNAVCAITDENSIQTTFMGGVFHVSEKQIEAEEKLQAFLNTLPSEKRAAFYEAWHQVPLIGEMDFRHKITELEQAGHHYLYALKKHDEASHLATQLTHEVVNTLQALVADIELLKIDLKEAFGIGKRWEDRFESLLQSCEIHSEQLKSKLEKSKYEYTSINKLIHECIDLYRPQGETRHIQFRVDLEQIADNAGKHKVLLIRMNQIEMGQAFRNVIDNAVKYSFSGTHDHPRWVSIIGKLQEKGDTLGYNIMISNLGVGIEEDETKLVFEPLYQGRRRHMEDRSGYGMGLSFVKSCIEKHGGTVTIQSQPQKRTAWLTSLSIWLPVDGPSQKAKEVQL